MAHANEAYLQSNFFKAAYYARVDSPVGHKGLGVYMALGISPFYSPDSHTIALLLSYTRRLLGTPG